MTISYHPFGSGAPNTASISIFDLPLRLGKSFEYPEVDIMLKKRISGSHRWEETNAVSPNICDDKQRFAKYP
jgi:hypothetical protein